MELEAANIPSVELGTKQMSFPMAVKQFFGQLPGQDLKGFAAELKLLTVEDREELCKLFKTVGYDVKP